MSDITNEYGKSKLKWQIEMLEIKLAQERTAHEATKKKLEVYFIRTLELQKEIERQDDTI